MLSGTELGFQGAPNPSVGSEALEPPLETDALFQDPHSSFMALPPSAILVPSYLIFLLVLRANGNVASPLSQSS